ncbi:MAG: alanine racemase [Acidobacteriota bacterium]|nr:alanine racemase [Acidobacteriota bacterium]
MDLDVFEANLARAVSDAKAAGKRLRPHVKAHKCVEVAKRQIAAGSAGVCVATVSEAEMLARAGFDDLLLTSPVADPLKIRRIVETGAIVVVDHPRQVEWYAEAAATANRQAAVLVDLDTGDHRTGVPEIERALELAIAIDRASHLWLRGVQAYSVSGSHGPDEATRRKISEDCFAFAAEARAECARHGLHTDVSTGGSTGTWTVDLGIADVNELQAGSYALMDLAYRRLGVGFGRAMTVLATVISTNHEGFVTVDAGFKAFSTDRPFGPEPVGCGEGVTYRWGGDEFGYIEGAPKLKLGDKVELVPPHCDPTANLYDRMYGCRGDRVEEIWPVMERMRV